MTDLNQNSVGIFREGLNNANTLQFQNIRERLGGSGYYVYTNPTNIFKNIKFCIVKNASIFAVSFTFLYDDCFIRQNCTVYKKNTNLTLHSI